MKTWTVMNQADGNITFEVMCNGGYNQAVNEALHKLGYFVLQNPKNENKEEK
jgi:hypothetical protein